MITMARRRLRARVNWAVRWGGAAAALLVVTAYCCTLGRQVFAYQYGLARGLDLSLCNGTLWLRWREGPSDEAPGTGIGCLPDRESYSPPGLAGALVRFGADKVHLSGTTNAPPTTSYVLDAPLWPVGLASLGLSACAWRRRQRQGPSSCPSCRYDLSGLPPGSPCPECARLPDH
jgi:hypothetical protein